MKNPEVLHLVNSYEWYDMIERGEKPEEYRSISVWRKRICRYGNPNHVNAEKIVCMKECPYKMPACSIQVPTNIKFVYFHRGYTNHTMMWSVKRIYIGKGNPQWGAPKEKVFIIELDKKLLP